MAGPFPCIQCFQEPGDRVAATRDGRVVLNYHFGASYPRQFIYPLLTPRAARSLTLADG